MFIKKIFLLYFIKIALLICDFPPFINVKSFPLDVIKETVHLCVNSQLHSNKCLYLKLSHLTWYVDLFHVCVLNVISYNFYAALKKRVFDLKKKDLFL